MSTLTILAGMPGCGKTTYARRLSAQTGAAVISSDTLRLIYLEDRSLCPSLQAYWAQDRDELADAQDWVFAQFRQAIAQALLEPTGAIADACHLREQDREDLRRIAAAQGWPVHLVLFDNVEQACQRNEARRGEDAYVDEKVMARNLVRLFETRRDIAALARTYASVTVLSSYFG